MVRRKLLKQFEEYNSKDLYIYWKDQYRIKHGSDYASRIYFGKEVSLFKYLLEKHDIFTVLLAICHGVQNGEKTVQFFVKNADRYIYNSDHPDIDFFVRSYGRDREHNMLLQLKLLEANWFHNSEYRILQARIVDNLREWIEELKDDKTDKPKVVEGAAQ